MAGDPGEVRLYEICNPSDPYTLRGTKVLAALAGLLLGNGQYPIIDVETNEKVLPFLAAASEAQVDGWLEDFKKENGITGTLGEYLKANAEKLAEVFASVLIGKPGDRKVFEATLEELPDAAARDRVRAKRHELTCTSLNDIGARAWALAAHYRKMAKEG
jgi:hypothetical protein